MARRSPTPAPDTPSDPAPSWWTAFVSDPESDDAEADGAEDLEADDAG